jgi:hypothetical protein
MFNNIVGGVIQQNYFCNKNVQVIDY